MDLKTIVVHFDKDTNVPHLMSVVKPLASDAQSHIVGVYTLPPMPHGIDMAGLWYEQLTRDFMAEYGPVNERLRTSFEESCGGGTYTREWRYISRPIVTIEEGILPEARAADIIVTGSGAAPGDAADARKLPNVLLSSGRPVVMVPEKGDFDLIDATVLIAWKNCREAARAVFDSIPILHRAKSIRMLTVDERAFGKQTHEPMGAADIATALSRHGLDVDVLHRQDPGDGVGETIISELNASGANLLVMGAYGHSRLREFVLGGATRHVLLNAPVPVLMTN